MRISSDPAARSSARAAILSRARLRDVNENRWARYGILTGLLEESAVEAARRIPGVASVEVDQERHLR